MDFGLSLIGGVQSLGFTVLAFLVVLTAVVFVHEFGHYWAARRCGVTIQSFSIGFGPELFGWKDRHGCRWKVSALPLGGYVKMLGDSDPTSMTHDAPADGGRPSAEAAMEKARPAEARLAAAAGEEEEPRALTPEELKGAFFGKSLAQKAFIVAAGPLANFLFAIAILVGLYLVFGLIRTTPQIGEVMPGTAAESAGLQPGDLVLEIDGRRIRSFEDITRAVQLNTGTAMRIVLERNGQQITVEATPQMTRRTILGMEVTQGFLGVRSSHGWQRVPVSPLEVVPLAIAETWEIGTRTLVALGQIVSGQRGTEEVGGPLRIAHLSGEVARLGIDSTLMFIVVLSVNLGLLNLFPVPMLDGGHLVFYGIEAVRGRPLTRRAQEVSLTIGVSLVVCLMIFATVNDLVHLKIVNFFVDLVSS